MSNRRKYCHTIDEDDLQLESQPQPRPHVHQRSKTWLTHQQSIRNTRSVANSFILGGRRGRGKGKGRGGGPSCSSSSSTPSTPSTRKTTSVPPSRISPSTTSSSVSSSSLYSIVSPTRISTSSSSSKKVLSRFYSVEEILGRREYQGKIEYLLKWQGYSDRFNSWETAINLTQDLIVEFEMSSPAMEMLSKEPKEPVMLKDTPIKIWDIRKAKNEELEYFVQWKNESDFDWIVGTIMRQAFPSLVIEFYERISKLVD